MYWWWKLGFHSKVENITITCTLELFNWPSLEVVWCRRIFHDNEMRKHRLCKRHPQDWSAQALKRAYTRLNHTGSQVSIYVYIYVEENVQTPSLYILFFIRPPTFPYFLLLSNLPLSQIDSVYPRFVAFVLFLVLISRF